MANEYVLWFRDVDLADLSRVGGKNASLGELTRHLASVDVPVPPGFAVTTDAFRLHVARAGLEDELYGPLERLPRGDVAELGRLGSVARELIRTAPLPREVEEAVTQAYAELCRSAEREVEVAVRSSATAEDLAGASFAGQQESYLNVQGVRSVLEHVRKCMASLFTDRAISYRQERGFAHRDVSISVGVQRMVRSDEACSGVMFTLDTESGNRDVTLVTGSWGLGESVVLGRVNPDEYLVHKPTLERGFRSILRRSMGDKRTRTVYGSSGTLEEPVPAEERARFVLSDDEVLSLARLAGRIEAHYSKRAGQPCPMDIEWAKDGPTGELFIVQARPETVHSQKREVFEQYELKGSGHVRVTGVSVGERIGVGRVRVVRSLAALPTFQKGDVLVAPMTDPDWEPVMAKASAIVTDQGGRTCHAAIVSRELGVPCIVGTRRATSELREGEEVTVSCAEGEQGKVYAGKIAFEKRVIDPAALPQPRVPVMLNVGSPEVAFRMGQLPSSGVGLARMEFIVSSWIGVHPMALVHPERVEDERVRAEVLKRARGFEPPSEFFVERLASGVAQIAAAFYPRKVILRFSDFKTNEYAGLVGGAAFEPREPNPMIGFRGASRYYDERYREAFALECQAVRRVRETMGLTNLAVMIPFCRTLEEGRRVVDEMAKNGLCRGYNGLEIYVMCEIPNNVILAEEFSDIFDGFSIGSNDLTQLTLGVDRDSSMLAHVFDERDAGVRRMIEMVVERAHSRGRPVGFCGQAPSDHAEFATFLADLQIDSISVTPDALLGVLERLRAK